MPSRHPKFEIIPRALVEDIIGEAFDVLARVGLFVENREAYDLLTAHGGRPAGPVDPDKGTGKLTLPIAMVEELLELAPNQIRLKDLRGETEVTLAPGRTHFDPGSAALFLHDPAAGVIRRPATADLRRYVRLVDRLPHYHLQSTALVSGDVPGPCSDSYRLYLALRYGRKPVVTGTFRKESFAVMREMLETVRGGAGALAQFPPAIFDACPSPPLMWSDLTSQSVMDAARAGLPSEFVSMPLTGSTAPITLAGALVQHAAETLAGVVLAQAAQPGAPVIWGGSPSAMDLRFGTTPMGAIETMMIDASYAAVGRFLDLPTHAYMGLSDAKQVDYQAGLESGLGIILAALAGINVVSGAGMLDFENCQSLEKLVLDHEACAMAYRMLRGVERRDEVMALDLLAELPAGGHLLTHPHTLKWYREEILVPGKALDRRARGADNLADLPTAAQRAQQEVERLLAAPEEPWLDEAVIRELDRIMEAELRAAGAAGLPKG
ncbi:MAG: hypothetical protein C4524_11655 [Candidatus Zixiibacteriota bacterium]|nr:MAG: hypothetical protein C4524_11655 [candidate division Zixibacteria bacterium]